VGYKVEVVMILEVWDSRVREWLESFVGYFAAEICACVDAGGCLVELEYR
jgi:hypothetical protein